MSGVLIIIFSLVSSFCLILPQKIVFVLFT